MSLILVAALIAVGLLGAVAVAVGIPLVLGFMAYDVYQSRETRSVRTVDVEHRIQLERGFARAFVIAGGLFWAVATFAGLNTFLQSNMAYSLLAAFLPLAATAATLVIGWYYERATAILLVLASFAVVVWGVMAAFEVGVWVIITLALIGPMMTAAVLFWLARRDQEALELSLAVPGTLIPIESARASRF